MRARLLLIAFLLALAPAAATAQEDGAMEIARNHFENGQDLFEKDDYAAAAVEFMAAYDSKPFPAFLYNAAVCFEKLKDYPKAVELFTKYITDDPKARDKKDVEKRIKALTEEIERQKTAPPVDPDVPPDPDEPPPKPTAVEVLPEVTTKGVVVVESKPAGATIYLDDKTTAPLGVTPWNGPLDGTHTIILESKGYKTETAPISPSADKLVWVYMALSEEHYLGWLEVRANIPGAQVFLDSKEVGAIGTTPFLGNVQPGKHTVIVSKPGYDEVTQEIEVERGKAHDVSVSLEKAPIGYVHVSGETVDGAKVYLDGKRVCDRAPCKFEAPAGEHEIRVSRGGRKTYKRTMVVGAATQTDLQVRLAPKPSRSDAVWELVFAAAFVGGGAYLGMLSDDTYAELERDIEAGNPPIDEDDDRFLKGKLFAYSADALYVVGGITFLVGVWDLVKDKGPSSVGVAESRDISVYPFIGPDFAGMGTEVRW